MPLPPLTLVLEFARAEQPDDPFAFRFAPQSYYLRTSGGGYERANFPWDETLLADLEAMRQPGGDPAVLMRLGELLRHFVTPLGWPVLAAQVLQATEQGRRVLLTIRSAAAELYALPWELLTLKASGQPIGELPEVLLSYEWPDTKTKPEQPLPRAGSGRILLAWSAAGGAVPAAEHVVAVTRACQAGFHPFEPAQDILANATLGRLSDTLSTAKREGRPVSVLHLLCHGGQAHRTFGLVLNGEPDQPGSVTVDADRLRHILAPHADMVRLVVLMACDGGNPGLIGNQLGSVAQTLHRAGIAAVVASRYPLSVFGSLQFTQRFYTALLETLQSQESALLGARAELAKDAAHRDWASIQLYARAEDGADSRPLVFRPYVGLAAFASEERRFFFGREALTSKLWQRCQQLVGSAGATRLLAILAPSGFGKSSVARAGLVAEIERRPLTFAQSKGSGVPTQVVLLKPGSHPLAALQAALPTCGADAPLLLLVDQFEEVYTLCTDKTERDAFVERLLSEASTPGRRILVVLTLRTDFLGETGRQHPKLNRLFGEQSELVTAMSVEELRRSIAAPAARLGRPLDDSTVNLLLSQVKDHDAALPLLEFALSQIWEGTLAHKESADTLQKVGGVGGALAGKAQEIYAALNEAEKATARRALVRLVRLGEGTRDTRRRAAISELCGRGETEAAVLSVIRKLATEQARMVTLFSEGAETKAEVTHEALFDHWDELRTWIEQSRKDRGLHERASDAANRWNKADRPTGYLWRPPDLDVLRDYQRRKPDELYHLVENFITSSVSRQKQESRLRIGAVLILITAFAMAAGIYIKDQRQVAAIERKRAQDAVASEQQFKKAAEKNRQLLLDTYVEQGRQLLVEKKNPNEAILWLHRAYAKQSANPILPDLIRRARYHIETTLAILLGHASVVSSATYSPDGKRIITVSAEKTARVWDAETGRLLAKLMGHLAPIETATYSPDGKRVVTASHDATARVWDAETGRLLAKLMGHTDYVLNAAYSPDGKSIVTASVDNTARVWDAETGRLLAKLMGHLAPIETATYSPDGKRVVTASHDATARVWDAETGRLLAVLKGHAGTVWTAMYSPDGKCIVTASDDKTARVWEAKSGRLLAKLMGHTENVSRATYSPDGKRIVTASMDKTARVWEAKSGQLLAALQGHAGEVLTATYSPDGKRIVTASMDKTARVWEAETGRLLAELNGHAQWVRTATYSPDGKRIVTASDDKTARVWEAETGRLLAELKGHADKVWTATYSPDGGRIVTTSQDKTARVWAAETKYALAELRGHADQVWTATYSPDGNRIVTTSQDKTARVWEAETGRLLAELKGHAASIGSAAYSPDGKRIATASEDNTARVWEAETGNLLAELKGHTGLVWSVAYSHPDGKRIVTASDDKTARVWEAETGRIIAELKGHEARVWTAMYSPDGKRIVTASIDHTARVWEAETGHLIVELKGHSASVGAATYSPDGKRIVTASEDKMARVWEAETGRLLAELKGHADDVSSAEYSPDGKRIVTASSDKTARVWEAETGRLLAELIGHEAHVWTAKYSPDGNRIVTASTDHTARVWEAETGRLLAELKGHEDSVSSAKYSPDGKRIVTASSDKTARIWDISHETQTPDQIGALIRCKAGVRFDSEDSTIPVAIVPKPADCQPIFLLPH